VAGVLADEVARGRAASGGRGCPRRRSRRSSGRCRA